MLRKLVYTISTLVILIAAASIFCSYDKARLHVHLSEKSPDGSKVAKVVWRWTDSGRGATINSWLIVEDRKRDSILFKRELRGGADIPQDMTREFLGISWDSNNVVLDVRGRYYDGPTKFESK